MPRIYMSFFVRGGRGVDDERWVCGFLESDLRTSIGRIRTFTSSDKVTAIIERGKGFPDLASRQAVDAALKHGRGGVYLSLTDDQYARLQR